MAPAGFQVVFCKSLLRHEPADPKLALLSVNETGLPRTHTHSHTHTHSDTHAHTHTHTDTRTHTHTHNHNHTHTHTSAHTHTHPNARPHAQTRTRTHMRPHARALYCRSGCKIKLQGPCESPSTKLARTCFAGQPFSAQVATQLRLWPLLRYHQQPSATETKPFKRNDWPLAVHP